MQDKATATGKEKPSGKAHDAHVDLIAAVVAITDHGPNVLTVGQADALPSGPFELGRVRCKSV